MARRTESNISSIIKQIGIRYPNKNIKELKLIPSSSTLLNLACSDKEKGGFAAGGMINLIGDSSSGKSILALSCLAECCYDPNFKNYDLYYDDVENANCFDLEYLFGSTASKKIKAPFYDSDKNPVPSHYIEDFHCNIADALEKGKPFIYVLDSFDALDAEQDAKKIEELRDARRKNKKVSGTYGMAKPKKSSEILRNICSNLKETESLLIIISQTRDNIDHMSFQRKTRSGGNALRFYAIHEIWLAKAGILKSSSSKRIVGNKVKAKVSKNKLTGKVREVELVVYYDYGVDDITPNIHFLVQEGYWKKGGSTIKAPSLKISGMEKTIVKEIEDKSLEDSLQKEVAKAWSEIEEGLKLNRKPKYK